MPVCRHCNQRGHQLYTCPLCQNLKRFADAFTTPPSNNFSSKISTALWPDGAGLNWFRNPSQKANGLTQSLPVFPSLQALGLELLSTQKGTTPSSSFLSPLPLFHSQEIPSHSIDERGERENPEKDMAFLNVDPTPLMFLGFARVIVQGRPKFARVVVPRAAPANEDLAIVTVSGFPPGEIPSAEVQATIVGLVEDEYELRIQEIQKCPFHRAQAFVRLNRATDRDALVQHSPHQRGGLSFTFVNHNRGPNTKRVMFNRECVAEPPKLT